MEKFSDNEIINIIVEQTNLYATQFVESHPNLIKDKKMVSNK